MLVDSSRSVLGVAGTGDPVPKKNTENGAAHTHDHADSHDHDHDHKNEGEEILEDGEEEGDDIVILSDADGNEREFRFLTVLEVDDQQFALLTTLDESEDADAPTEVFIFHYEEDEDGGEVFADIEDEVLFNKVQAAAEAMLSSDEEEDE